MKYKTWGFPLAKVPYLCHAISSNFFFGTSAVVYQYCLAQGSTTSVSQRSNCFFFPNDCREYKNTPFTKLPSNIHFKFQSCLYVIFIPVDDWSNMNAGNWNGESAVLNVHLCKYFYRNASPFLELHCLSLLHISQVVLLDL